MEIQSSVSVIIPTYNCAATIIQAIDSVLKQTVLPSEIIVVDDGSTDTTRDILSPYCANNSIIYLHQENKGCGAARNAGIAIAKGEYIAFLDADDYWSPEKLECQQEVFRQHPESILCYTESIIVDEYGNHIAPKRNAVTRQHSGNVTRYLAFHNIITLSSAVVRREVLRNAHGFTETYDLMMFADLDLWLRLAPAGSIYALEKPLTYYRTRSTPSAVVARDNYRRIVAIFRNAMANATGVTKFWYFLGFTRASILHGLYQLKPFRVWKQIGIRGIARECYRRITERMEWLLYPILLKRLANLQQTLCISDDVLFDFVYTKSFGILVLGQIESEIREFIRLARAIAPRTILEIGTANGGNLFLLANSAVPGGTVMSIDLPGGEFGGGYFARKQRIFNRLGGADRSMTLIRGDSHAEASLEKIKATLHGAPLDVLFIDGDHTYEGVRADFEMYHPLVRAGGIVAFHDIANPPAENYGVKKFWNEIKNSYESREIIADRTQHGYGIGVLYMK